MIDNNKEYILCAACKYKLDGKKIITLGYRHKQAKSMGNSLYWEYVTDQEDNIFFDQSHEDFIKTAVDGFLTSKNRFVDAVEAAILAADCGQFDISPKYREDGTIVSFFYGELGHYELKSEDIY